MQAQNVSSTVTAFCSSIFGSVKSGTVWLGYAIADWSKSGLDLLARVAYLVKDILAIAWNSLSSFFRLTKNFCVANPNTAVLLGGGMAVLTFLGIYWHFNETTLADASI